MARAATKVKMQQQHDFVPWVDMIGFIRGTTHLVDSVDGTAEIQSHNYADADIVVVTFSTAGGGTQVDDYSGMIVIPTHWDRLNKIYMRVISTANASVSSGDTIDYRIRYSTMKDGDAFVAPTTALNTPITTFTFPTSSSNQHFFHTEWGVINAGSIAVDKKYLGLELSVTAQTGGPEPSPIGIEVRYTPKFYKGFQREAPVWVNT